MSKVKTENTATVQELLDAEKKKNRIKTTGILVALALVAGLIGGYFLSIEVTANATSRVVNSIEIVSK